MCCLSLLCLDGKLVFILVLAVSLSLSASGDSVWVSAHLTWLTFIFLFLLLLLLWVVAFFVCCPSLKSWCCCCCRYWVFRVAVVWITINHRWALPVAKLVCFFSRSLSLSFSPFLCLAVSCTSYVSLTSYSSYSSSWLELLYNTTTPLNRIIINNNNIYIQQ